METRTGQLSSQTVNLGMRGADLAEVVAAQNFETNGIRLKGEEIVFLEGSTFYSDRGVPIAVEPLFGPVNAFGGMIGPASWFTQNRPWVQEISRGAFNMLVNETYGRGYRSFMAADLTDQYASDQSLAEKTVRNYTSPAIGESALTELVTSGSSDRRLRVWVVNVEDRGNFNFDETGVLIVASRGFLSFDVASKWARWITEASQTDSGSGLFGASIEQIAIAFRDDGRLRVATPTREGPKARDPVYVKSLLKDPPRGWRSILKKICSREECVPNWNDDYR